LNDALEGLDLDLGYLEARLMEDGRFDFGRDDAVINILAGPLMSACRRSRGRPAALLWRRAW
jgi:hypothetical protein